MSGPGPGPEAARAAGAAAYEAGSRREARDRWTEALEGYEAAGEGVHAARTRLALAVVTAELDDLDAARRHARRALLELEELEDCAVDRAREILAAQALDRDDRATARALLAELSSGPRTALLRARYAVETRRQDALDLCLAAEQAGLATGDPLSVGRARALLALGFALEGHADQALVALGKAQHGLVRLGRAKPLVEAGIYAARAWLALARPDRARLHAEEALLRAEEEELHFLARLAEGVADRAAERGGVTVEPLLEQWRQVSAALANVGPEEPAQVIADTARQLLHGRRALVLLEREGELGVVAVSPPYATEPPPSQTVMRRALRSGRVVVIDDMALRPELSSAPSIGEGGLRAVRCAPILVEGERLGVLYVDAVASATGTALSAAALLEALAAQAAQSMLSARREAALAERLALERELVHDLRNPLTSVSAAIELLDPAVVPAETVDELRGIIAAAAKRMDEMLEHAFGQRVEPELVDLESLVRDLVRLTRPVARGAGLTLRVRCQGRPVVLGWRTELGRAIGNLLSNALRFGPEGSEIVVELEGKDPIQLRVRDTGPGVVPELVDRLFERGVQGARPGSAGLGLAVVRRVAELHGGVARYDGGHDGACFTLVLPAASQPS